MMMMMMMMMYATTVVRYIFQQISDLIAKGGTETLQIFRIVARITIFHVVPLDAEVSDVADVDR